MKSIFLSPEQVFDRPLPVFEKVGTAAPASDLALLTVPDDGFVYEAGGGMNYYLSGDACADRFGRRNPCTACALRPALLLEPGEEALLQHERKDGTVTTVDYGMYPTTILDRSLRDMAEKQLTERSLRDTGRHITVRGTQQPVYRLGAKQMIVLTLEQGGANGYLQLSDGTIVSEGDRVFLELRPVRWLYDAENRLLISCMALFGGWSREDGAAYLNGTFLSELAPEADDELPEDGAFRFVKHDELSLIRAYVEADIPVFIHGLSGDGKSDRVRQIDPEALDIELVNETPETINGRAVYNEAKDEIVDIKPAWLVHLERLCRNGEPHILFFDELTRARGLWRPAMTAASPAPLMTWQSRSSAVLPMCISTPRWKTGCPGRSAHGSTRISWNSSRTTTSISAPPIPERNRMPIPDAGRWRPARWTRPAMTLPSWSPLWDGTRRKLL